MRSRAWLLLALPLLAPAAAAADISVRTDRNPVALSESFQIEFEAQGGVDDDPDFSPLESDFEIISTSQSNRLSIVNGRSSAAKTWTLTVLARRTGTLRIPSIAFGTDRSPAGSVEVTSRATTPGRQPAESNEVFLEVEAQPLAPYVQQQIVYKVRLFRAFPTANASLSEPQAEHGGAVIERIGEDSTYDTRVNGRPYQVVERRYSIYPQASGTLKIGPLTFRGQTGAGPFSMLDPFGRRTEMIVRQSAPVELEVRGRPDSGQGPWLPARSLTLHESWSTDGPEFRVGDPVTRTLTVSADGLTASQLPELPPWVPETFKSYPDQPELSDAKSTAGITGTRVEKVAVIPSVPGVYEMPAISVRWWNTERDRLEYAELPAQRIQVLPATGIPAPASQPADPAAAPQPPARMVPAPEIQGDRTAPGPWPWVSAALGLFWIATLAAWWWQSRRRAPSAGDARVRSLGEVWRDLKGACSRNDPGGAKDCLLAWALLRWPDDAPRSIGDIAERCELEFAQCLRKLDAHLYGREQGTWDGSALWRAFAATRSNRHTDDEDAGSELEPLHRI